jgi:hypothetical protein
MKAIRAIPTYIMKCEVLNISAEMSMPNIGVMKRSRREAREASVEYEAGSHAGSTMGQPPMPCNAPHKGAKPNESMPSLYKGIQFLKIYILKLVNPRSGKELIRLRNMLPKTKIFAHKKTVR